MKPYIVKGFALVPVEVVVHVTARNDRAALSKAETLFKSGGRRYMVANSYDDSAIHDFRANEATEDTGLEPFLKTLEGVKGGPLTDADGAALSHIAKLPGWFELHDLPWQVRRPRYRLDRLVGMGVLQFRVVGKAPNLTPQWFYGITDKNTAE